jgi:deazaflavin-dependent oxidoreductase (nitroreductase family)
MPGDQQQSPPAQDFNQRIINEFRTNGGIVGGMFQGTPLILITTEGRHSHRPRTNPVTYLRDGGRYLIFGSNLGRPAHPGWYHNLLASPQVTIEVGTGDGHIRMLSALAVVLHGTERDRLYERQSVISRAFADYQEKTSRTIPVIALHLLDLSHDSERSQLVGEQLIAHHNDLRARLGGIRAQLKAARDGSPAVGAAGLDALSLAAQLRQHCLSYCHSLELHHIREDGAFTAFEQQFPHLAPVISRLRAEHRAMAEALAGLEEFLAASEPGGADAITDVFLQAVTSLEEHFAYEEEQLLPALRQQ